MRISIKDCRGLYLQYTSGAKPVEVFDRVAYAFTNEDRTCLVADPRHVALFLATGRYRVAGFEMRETIQTIASIDADVSLTTTAPDTKKRGRPRKV